MEVSVNYFPGDINDYLDASSNLQYQIFGNNEPLKVTSASEYVVCCEERSTLPS